MALIQGGAAGMAGILSSLSNKSKRLKKEGSMDKAERVFTKIAKRDFPFMSDKDKDREWYKRSPHPGLIGLLGAGQGLNAAYLMRNAASKPERYLAGGLLGASALMGLYGGYSSLSDKQSKRDDLLAEYNMKHDGNYSRFDPKVREYIRKNLKENKN